MFSITPTAYYISQGQNAICIISAPRIRRKRAERDDSLLPKTLCSQSNKIRSVLRAFVSFLHLHLFDKAASSDGKWVDESRQKPVTWSVCWRIGRQLINK